MKKHQQIVCNKNIEFMLKLDLFTFDIENRKRQINLYLMAQIYSTTTIPDQHQPQIQENKYRCSCCLSFIEAADFSKAKIEVNNDKDSESNLTSKFFSFSIAVIFLYLFHSPIYNFISRNEIDVKYYKNIDSNKIHQLDMKNNIIMAKIQGQFENARFFTFNVDLITKRENEGFKYEPVTYLPCRDAIFPDQTEEIRSYLTSLSPEWYCLPGNSSYQLQGSKGSKNISYLSFSISPCINTTTNKCASASDIQKYIDQNKRFELLFYYGDILYDPSNISEFSHNTIDQENSYKFDLINMVEDNFLIESVEVQQIDHVYDFYSNDVSSTTKGSSFINMDRQIYKATDKYVRINIKSSTEFSIYIRTHPNVINFFQNLVAHIFIFYIFVRFIQSYCQKCNILRILFEQLNIEDQIDGLQAQIQPRVNLSAHIDNEIPTDRQQPDHFQMVQLLEINNSAIARRSRRRSNHSNRVSEIQENVDNHPQRLSQNIVRETRNIEHETSAQRIIHKTQEDINPMDKFSEFNLFHYICFLVCKIFKVKKFTKTEDLVEILNKVKRQQNFANKLNLYIAYVFIAERYTDKRRLYNLLQNFTTFFKFYMIYLKNTHEHSREMQTLAKRLVGFCFPHRKKSIRSFLTLADDKLPSVAQLAQVDRSAQINLNKRREDPVVSDFHLFS